MAFCQYCGSQIGESDKFCCVCGKANVAFQNPNFNQTQNPPIYSQIQPLQSQGYSSGQQYPPQSMQQRGNLQQPFQQQNAQSGAPFNISPLLYKTIQNDSRTKEIFDYIQERGWLNQDPTECRGIDFKINDLAFSFLVLDDNGILLNKFCIIGCLTNFDEDDYDDISYIALMFPRFEFSFNTIIYSKDLNEDDEVSMFAFQFILDKSLIEDSLKLFDCVIKDMMEAYQKFIDSYNNLS